MSFDAFFDYPSGDSNAGSGEAVFLRDWTEAQWAALLDHAETVRLGPGDVLCSVHDVERVLYLLGAGELEAVVGFGPRARRVPVRQGELIGEVGFFDGGARTATVVAVAPSVVHRLSLEDVEVFAARHADLGRSLLLDLGRILAQRLRRVESLREY